MNKILRPMVSSRGSEQRAPPDSDIPYSANQFLEQRARFLQVGGVVTAGERTSDPHPGQAAGRRNPHALQKRASPCALGSTRRTDHYPLLERLPASGVARSCKPV